MSVNITVEWQSSHQIEPPPGVSDEDFESELRDSSSGSAAWAHALDQVDSGTAELMNWSVA